VLAGQRLNEPLEIPHAPLLQRSRREREILEMIAASESTATLAHQLAVTEAMVYTHRKRIIEKLGLRSSDNLLCYALQHTLSRAQLA
jgi:DNA-binding CsgD family transcriptional regulator